MSLPRVHVEMAFVRLSYDEDDDDLMMVKMMMMMMMMMMMQAEKNPTQTQTLFPSAECPQCHVLVPTGLGAEVYVFALKKIIC